MDISKFGKYKNIAYVLFFAVCLFLLGQISTNLIRNSDDAVSAFIGLSMVKDGFGISEWVLCTSSFYFTDLIFHGFLALFTSSPHIISSFASFFIVIPIFICSYKIYTKAAPSNNTSLWMFMLVFAIMLHGIEYHFFKSPNHTGAVSFCLIALLAFYNDNQKYKNLSKVVFVLFTAMAIESDKYSLFYLVLPILTQVAIDWFQNKKFNYNIILLLPVIVLILLYNMVVGYQVPGMGQHHFVEAEKLGSHFYFWFFGLFRRFNAWVWGKPVNVKILPILLRSIFLFAILLSYVLCIYFFKIKNKWINFFIFSSFFISCGYIFSELGKGFDTSRYLVPILFNGTMLLVILLSKVPLDHKKIVSAVCATATILLLFCDARVQTKKYHNFIENHPVIDLINQENFKSGYASFWDAYANGILFPDVRILPIKYNNPRMMSFGWLSPRSYKESANFILLGKNKHFGVYKETIETFFGKPQKVITKGDYTILKYDYDLSSRLDESLFYGRELPNGIKVIENKDKSVTNQNIGEKGFLTFGPYVSKPKGTYEIVVSYELSDDGKAWFDVVANKGKKNFIKKSLLSENNQISETLVFDKDVDDLEVRVYYQGSGYLTVKSIKINEQ